MRKLIVIILIACSPQLMATDTYLRYLSGSLVVVDGVIQVGPGTPTPTSDLVLEYLFGANGSESTITLDTSGNSYTGTVSGATWVAATNGITDRYNFNGSSDKISALNSEVGTGLDLSTNDFTVMGWYKADSAGSTADPICSKRINSGDLKGWLLYASTTFGESGLVLDYGAGNDNNIIDVNANDGAWHHLVGVRDGLSTVVYSDGYPVSTASVGVASSFDTTADFKVGQARATPTVTDGDIWAVELYAGTALTASEILATNLAQKVKLGVASGFITSDESLYSSNVLFWSGNATTFYTDGSSINHSINTTSLPIEDGTPINGWASWASPNKIRYADHPSLSFTNAVMDKPFTVTTWIRPNTTNLSAQIFGKNAWSSQFEYRMQLTAGFPEIRTNDGNSNNRYRGRLAGVYLPTNTFSQLTFTYDGSGVVGGYKIYLNSVRVDDTDISASTYANGMSDTTAEAAIGVFNLLGSYFDGDIDEVGMYQGVWTPTQVTNYFEYSNTNLGHNLP